MTTRPAPRRGPLIVLLGAVLVAVAGAAGLWYLFLRPAGPAPVSLASLPPLASLPAASSPSASTLDGIATPGSQGAGSPAATGGATGGITGTWQVDRSIGSFADGSGSFVGYRVREQLATVGATEAVGRTPGVTGSLTIDGTTVTAVEITADLTTLQSDEANRDRQLTHQALQTSQFPSATFSLTQPIDLGSVPAEGAVVQVTATGDLTLHGVTRSVQVPLQARLQGGVVTIAGSLPITFADWSIQPPQAMILLSVEDHGTMELQLQLTRG